MRTTGAGIKNVNVDDLTERVRIVYREKTRNSRGDIIDGEERLRAEVWAKVLPREGTRREEGAETRDEMRYQVTIRYRGDVLPDDEVHWRGRKLRQTSPALDVEGRRLWLQMDCKEWLCDESSEV